MEAPQQVELVLLKDDWLGRWWNPSIFVDSVKWTGLLREAAHEGTCGPAAVTCRPMHRSSEPPLLTNVDARDKVIVCGQQGCKKAVVHEL